MVFRVLAFIALLALPVPALAATDGDVIGSIMAAEGTVTIKRAGEETASPAAVAMPLHLHDTIETGPESRAIAVFIDETQLTLGADAQMTMDEYVFEPAAKSGNRARASILRGAFLYASGLIGKQERPDVQIKIAYGAIGLRGTTVWGGMLDQYGIFVLDGKVSVQTKRGSMMLNKGEGVDLASANAAPSGRKVWGQPKIDSAVATITLTAQEDATKRVTAELERLREENVKAGAPAPEKKEEAPQAPAQPAPEAPAPEKRTDNGFGEESPADQVEKARNALEDRREELQPVQPQEVPDQPPPMAPAAKP